MTKNTKLFWELLSQAHGKGSRSCEKLVTRLEKLLLKLSAEELIDFDNTLEDLLAISYKNELWAAAYIINGGSSEDGFLYFRAWLISQGQAVFSNALRDPQTLVDVDLPDEEDAECEELLYVAMSAYKTKIGTEMPVREHPKIELTGKDWTPDMLETMYPRLCAKF